MSSDANKQHKTGMQLGLNDSTLALAGVAVLLVAIVFWGAGGPNIERTDFAMTYVGAKIVHDGLGPRLYDIGLQVKLRDSLFQHASPLYFEHPPFEALLLSPLANLNFRTAYLIWGLINVSILLCLVVWLRGLLPWPREHVAYFALWLVFAPLLVTLYQGQSSIVVLAAYAITYVHLRRGSLFLAGIALGLGLFKLQFAIPFAIIFLLRRQLRFVAGFALSFMFAAVLSMIATGWHGTVEYGRFLLRIGSHPENLSFGSASDMPTLYGLLHTISHGHLTLNSLNIAVALLSVALLSSVAWSFQHTTYDSGFALAAAVSTSLLCGSHMFTQDFSPLLLGMFLAGAALRTTRRALRVLMGLVLAMFWTFPIYFFCVKWHCMYLLAFLLLFFTWLCLKLGHDRQTQDVPDAQIVAVS